MSNLNRFFTIFTFLIFNCSFIFAQIKTTTTANLDSICFGADKKIELQCIATNGTSPYTFYWSTGATSSLNDSTSICPVNGTLSKNTSFRVTVTDAGGNKKVDTVTVYVTPEPTMTLIPNFNLCLGANSYKPLTLSKGAFVAISNKDKDIVEVTIIGKDSLIFKPIKEGKATISIIPKTVNGCFGSENEFTINIVLPLDPKLITDTTIVKGDTLTLLASNGSLYNWNTIPFQNTPAITIVPTKNSTYTVTITDKNGCTSSSTAKVNVDNILSIKSIKSSNQKFCEKDSTKFNLEAEAIGGNNTFSYAWSDGSKDKKPTFTQPLNVGVYTYIVTITSNIQKKIDSIKIEVISKPAPIITTQQSNPCINEKALYFADDNNKVGKVNYTWDVNDSLYNNIMAFDGNTYIKGKNGNPLLVTWKNTGDINLKVIGKSQYCAASSNDFKINIAATETPKDKGIGYIKTNGILYYRDSTAKCYQWGFIDSTGFNEIPKETFQAFVPKEKNEGSKLYAVRVCNPSECPLISIYRQSDDNQQEQTPNQESFTLYPNPNSGHFFIKATRLQEKNYTLCITDIMGRNILKKNIQTNNGNFIENINQNAFQSGIYFAYLYGQNNKVIKFIVQ